MLDDQVLKNCPTKYHHEKSYGAVVVAMETEVFISLIGDTGFAGVCCKLMKYTTVNSPGINGVMREKEVIDNP